MENYVRKSAQEVEIDHLLAEEFSCDLTFGARFLIACGLPGSGYQTESVFPEPSFSGHGYGDLLVEGHREDRRTALLIEDKITAAAATRQAARYAEHAERMRDDGWDDVWTILVAPRAYCGERNLYDASLDLETLAELLRSTDPRRLAYRRGIIEHALEKSAHSGVKAPDILLHKLKSEYLEYVNAWCAREAFPATFPPLLKDYYDGDSWIEKICHRNLPEHVELRHRLWVSVKKDTGLVDLIATRADDIEKRRFYEDAPDGATTEDFSNGKGVKVSFELPQLRQNTGFNPDIADEACQKMRVLVNWYLQEKTR